PQRLGERAERLEQMVRIALQQALAQALGAVALAESQGGVGRQHQEQVALPALVLPLVARRQLLVYLNYAVRHRHGAPPPPLAPSVQSERYACTRPDRLKPELQLANLPHHSNALQ